jgi:hypothetical protein
MKGPGYWIVNVSLLVKRNSAFAFAMAFAGCGGSAQSAFTPPGSVPPANRSNVSLGSRVDPTTLFGHLYAAGALVSGSNVRTFVRRYAVRNGIPDRGSDRRYPGAWAPLALDSANSLYTVEYLPAAPTVYVYPPNSNKPNRTLTLTCPDGSCSPQVGALAVDAHGYLYVGYNWVVQSEHCHCALYFSVVWIFAPGATGNATPIQTIWIDQGSVITSVGGLALHNRDLLVSTNGSANAVCTYRTPVTNPTLVRTLTGPGIVDPYGLAIDHGEVYVANNYGTPGPWFVAAYPVDASGSQYPDREIEVSGEKNIGIGIAVKANRLFVPDYIANGVYEVDATKGGAQQPLATLKVPTAIDVKLGQ